jgi:YHS domain-containing protein
LTVKTKGWPLPVDPVCGMEVDDSTPFKAMYRGKVYYFCSEACLRAFKRDPEKYLREGPKGMPS